MELDIQGLIGKTAKILRDIRVIFKTEIKTDIAIRYSALGVRAGVAEPTAQKDPTVQQFAAHLHRLIPATAEVTNAGFTAALLEFGEIGRDAMKKKIKSHRYTPRPVYLEKKREHLMQKLSTGEEVYGLYEARMKRTDIPGVYEWRGEKYKTITRSMITRVPKKLKRPWKPGGRGYSTGALHDSIGFRLEDPGRVGLDAQIKGTGGYKMVLIGPEVDPKGSFRAAAYKDSRTGRSRASRPPKIYGKYVDEGSRHFHHPVHYRQAALDAIRLQFQKVMERNWDAAWAGRVRRQIIA